MLGRWRRVGVSTGRNRRLDKTGYTWWGKSASGDIYRYKGQNGEVHFNGSESSGTFVRPEIKAWLQ
jgi:hypothetical protein